MALHGTGYCIECGEKLETGHRFCFRCGTERWRGAIPPPTGLAPPSPGTPAFNPEEPTRTATGLALLPWLYAAGAVYWLITCARAAAYLVAPNGTHVYITQSGVNFPGMNDPGFASFALALSLALYAVAAVLHAAAYFGLRRRTTWGWTVAVLVAAVWSLLLVGIPVLYLLMRRATRRAFGIG